jgi:uncharacterized membrane protein YedE/YeeE
VNQRCWRCVVCWPGRAGLGFGFFAQRSRFCLRAAVIEFWHGKFGDKLTVWLLAFGSAVVGVQLLIVTGALDVSTARQLSARGSLSGALLGGIIFGVGMTMTRGCASRLLVLSATGNLRALLSGLVFVVAAQASLSGVLAPWCLAGGWWTVCPRAACWRSWALGRGTGWCSPPSG